jgi:protein MPE1
VGTTAADALNNDHRIESHAREALLQKQKQQALRSSGALYGSNTKRFDEKEVSKVCNPSCRSEGGLMERMLGYLSLLEMRMRMQGFKLCLPKTQISGNRCKKTCRCESPPLLKHQQICLRHSQSRGGNGMRGRPRAPGPAGGAGPGRGGKFDYSMPTDKEPPVGYICYRCGQKGA